MRKMNAIKNTISKMILLTFVVTIIMTITGCKILPPPSSAIKPPKYTKNLSDDIEDSKAIARRFLIPGTQFAYPIHPQNTDAVRKIDIEGDGLRELLVLYRGRDLKNNGTEVFGVFILKQKKNEQWHIFWQHQYTVNIVALDWAEVRDITGDSYPELLLGWSIGYRLGSNLDIFSLKHKPEPQLISSIKYGEIVSIEDKKVTNNETRSVFKLYLFDEERYKPENEEENDELLHVLRWNESEWIKPGLVPAEEVYPAYYKDIIKSLQRSLEGYWNNYYEWYFLADAQLKSGKYNDAITSIDKALEVIQDHINRHGPIEDAILYQKKSRILKAEAYIKSGLYHEAIVDLDSIRKKYDNTYEDLRKIYLNYGRAYIGLGQYGTAKDTLEKSCKIAELVYPKESALYIINTYMAKKELDYIKPLTSKKE